MIVDKFENEREKKGMVKSCEKHERVVQACKVEDSRSTQGGADAVMEVWRDSRERRHDLQGKRCSSWGSKVVRLVVVARGGGRGGGREEEGR